MSSKTQCFKFKTKNLIFLFLLRMCKDIALKIVSFDPSLQIAFKKCIQKTRGRMIHLYDFLQLKLCSSGLKFCWLMNQIKYFGTKLDQNRNTFVETGMKMDICAHIRNNTFKQPVFLLQSGVKHQNHVGTHTLVHFMMLILQEGFLSRIKHTKVLNLCMTKNVNSYFFLLQS